MFKTEISKIQRIFVCGAGIAVFLSLYENQGEVITHNNNSKCLRFCKVVLLFCVERCMKIIIMKQKVRGLFSLFRKCDHCKNISDLPQCSYSFLKKNFSVVIKIKWPHLTIKILKTRHSCMNSKTSQFTN